MENVSPLFQKKKISYFFIGGIFRTFFYIYLFSKKFKKLGKIHNPKSRESRNKSEEELYMLIMF
jgi:hypothetical protein